MVKQTILADNCCDLSPELNSVFIFDRCATPERFGVVSYEMRHLARYIDPDHPQSRMGAALRFSLIGQVGLIWVQIGQICQIGELTGQIEHTI